MRGLWILATRKGEVDLYTNRAVDVVVDKTSGVEYKRGRRVLFEDKELPDVVENHPDKYKLVVMSGKGVPQIDYIKEIYVNTLLRR